MTLRLLMPGLARRLLIVLGDVEATFRRHIREFVRDVADSPAAHNYTRIDLEHLIERVWEENLIGEDASELWGWR